MNATFFSIRRFLYHSAHYSIRHKHPFYELNCYFSGSGTTTVGEQSYPFSAHSFALIPPGIRHDESYRICPGEVICLIFQADNLPFSVPEPVVACDRENPFFGYLRTIYREAVEQNDQYQTVIGHLMKLLLIEMERILSPERNPCNSLTDIRNYINEHYGEKMNFQQLAAQSGYSYDYFRHIFKSRYGLSPQNYLIQMRLDTARKMLAASPDISITKVAEICGFSDSSQLSTMFGARFGISPKRFQKAAERNLRQHPPG